MKKQIALLTVLALVFTILAGMTPVYAAEEQPAMIYVATDGSDSADGSASALSVSIIVPSWNRTCSL